MNERERFLNTCRFKPVDRLPLWPPLGIWGETFERWGKEGLTDYSVSLVGAHNDPQIELYDFLGCDRLYEIGIYYGICPKFEPKVLEETERFITHRSYDGRVMKEFKELHDSSMPEFIDYPVHSKEDYREFKKRLTLNYEQRFPENWKEKCKVWKQSKIPLRMWADDEGGFFAPIRNMLGTVETLYAFHDDPAWVEEMMEDRMNLILEILDVILRDVKFDFFMFFEDMAYKCGPLISPEMFKKYMVPRYKKVTDFLHSKGIDLIFVDSDGDITKLIPLWLECGVNGIIPFEVQAGMDVVKLRKEYGKDLIMAGGVDKRALALGKPEIDTEINRVAQIFDQGGFIPWLDHLVPPDVSFDHFLYYYDRLDRAIHGRS